MLIVGVKHKDLPTLFSMANVRSSFYELLIFGAITAALLVLWVRHQKRRAISDEREAGPRALCNSKSKEALNIPARRIGHSVQDPKHHVLSTRRQEFAVPPPKRSHWIVFLIVCCLARVLGV